MKIDEVACLEDNKGIVWHISWNPNGNQLACCGEDKTIRIYRLIDKEWLLQDIIDNAHTKTIRCVEWSPSGKYFIAYYYLNSYLASCSFDNKVLIWSKINFEWETIATLDGHENEVKSISWNKLEEYIASCGRDKRIFIYGRSSDNEYDCITILDGHTQDIKFIKWYNNVLYSCSYDNSIRMWNEYDDNWICNQIIVGHKTTVWEIDFNDDNIMYSCDGDGVIGIWELNSKNRWENVKLLSNLHSMTVYSINYNKDLNILVTGCRDNIIRYFEYDDEEKELNLIDDFQSHESDINCVRWNPVKTNILCSCSDDEKVKIWKVSEILD